MNEGFALLFTIAGAVVVLSLAIALAHWLVKDVEGDTLELTFKIVAAILGTFFLTVTLL